MMDKQSMSPYEVAVKMYHREHNRWSQWALFFFGSIAGIFVLSEKHAGSIPFWLSCFVASLLSGIWVVVAQNIRATTYSWMQVILRIECNEEVSTFHAFEEELQKRTRIKDLLTTLCLWKLKTWLSVTRLLALLGVGSSLLFFIIGILALIKI
ncbi:MAG: hypothetical protein AB1424_11790 [Thermodesulfobacteriota bacterium]